MSDGDAQIIEGQPDEGGIANLRAAADENPKLKAELERSNKMNAMLRAGVDIDSRVGQMYLDTYTGEIDVESIKADAATVPGVLRAATEPVTTPPVVTPDQQLVGDLRQQLAGEGGTAAPIQISQGDLQVGFDQFHQRLAQGHTRQAASAEVITRIIDQAARGNEAFIFKGWTPEQLAQVGD